jgi:hypothetical protein
MEITAVSRSHLLEYSYKFSPHQVKAARFISMLDHYFTSKKSPILLKNLIVVNFFVFSFFPETSITSFRNLPEADIRNSEMRVPNWIPDLVRCRRTRPG